MDVQEPARLLLYLLLLPVSVRCYCERLSWGENGTLFSMCRANDVTANSVIYLDTSGGLQNIQGVCWCKVMHNDYPNTTPIWITVVGHASTTSAFQVGDYIFKKDLKLQFNINSGTWMRFHKSVGQGESPICVQLMAATNQQIKPTTMRVVCYAGQKYVSPTTTKAAPIEPVVAVATSTTTRAITAAVHSYAMTTTSTGGYTNATRHVDNGETGSEGGNAGVVAGVVIGVLVLAVTVAVVVAVAYKKRQSIIGTCRLSNINKGKSRTSCNNKSESGSAAKVTDSTRTTERLVLPQQESASHDAQQKGKLAGPGCNVDAYYTEISNEEDTPQCNMTEDGYVDVDDGYECPKSTTGYVYGDIGVKGPSSGYVYGDIGAKGCDGTVSLH